MAAKQNRLDNISAEDPQAAVKKLLSHIEELQLEIKNLTDTKEFSENLLETANTIILTLDTSACITTFNKYAEELTGYKKEEVLGKNWFTLFIPQKNRSIIPKVFKRALIHMPDVSHYENPILIKNGEQRLINWSNNVLYDGSGNITGVLSVGMDITKRKKAENALRRNEEKFRALVESTSDWIWEVNAEGVYTYCSPQVETILGFRPEEIIGTTPFDVMPADAVGEMKEIFTDLVSKQMPIINLENVCLHKDGRRILLETSGIPFFNEAGILIGYRGVDRDITMHEQTKNKLNTIFNNTQDAITIHDLDGKIIDVNEKMCKMNGLSREEALSVTIKDISGPGMSQQLMSHYWARAVSGKDLLFEWKGMRPKDGYVFDVEVSLKRLDFDNKQVILANVRDITERKKSEEALRNSENKMRSIFRVAPTGIGTVKERVLTELNPRVCEMLGYSKEELTGKNARILYPSQEDYDYVGKEKYRQISIYGTGTVETRWKKKDGSLIDVLLASTPIDIKDISNGVTFTALDITKRKMAESQIKASLAEKEILLQEVHHRVKNNLQQIVSLLKLELVHYNRDLDVYADVIGRIQRFSAIHSKLYKQEDISQIDFAAFIHETLDELISINKYNENQIQLDIQIAKPIIELNTAIPVALLINELLTNSVKYAFEKSGKITIVLTQDSNGSIEEILYTDNGKGMTGSEPGFGTKVIKILAEQLDLAVTVESDKGTRYRFVRTTAMKPISQSDPGSILYIENEIIIATERIHSLKSMGFNVHEKAISSGEKAVEYVTESKYKPSLILMDIGLSGKMDGIEAARGIREKFDIPIVFLTGYEDPGKIEAMKTIKGTSIMQKTCSDDELKKTLDHWLKAQDR